MIVRPPKGFQPWEEVVDRLKRAATFRRSGVHFDVLGMPPAPPSTWTLRKDSVSIEDTKKDVRQHEIEETEVPKPRHNWPGEENEK